MMIIRLTICLTDWQPPGCLRQFFPFRIQFFQFFCDFRFFFRKPYTFRHIDGDFRLRHFLVDLAVSALYENRITTGTAIDGKCIRLSTIEKYCGSWDMQRFRQAMKNKEKFSTLRFDFCGYDGTLWCEPRDNGDMAAGFSKEYRNCGNGYYYLLINDEFVIGYDID